ncbi:MAG: hypothetical protein IPH35_20205 [Rhodoferax sp.]|nr:hypothetical protein [Rhodoferax sp.]
MIRAPQATVLGCPLRLMLVALGQVLDYRGESSLGITHGWQRWPRCSTSTVCCVTRNSSAKPNQSGARCTGGFLEFDTAVDMHAHCFEHRPLPRLHGRGHQGGCRSGQNIDQMRAARQL